MESTIAALATAPAPAGLAVIRISGSDAASLLSRCFKAKRNPVAHPREMIYGTLLNPENGQALDSCLAVFMKGPKSFTGEDLVELHLHGSPLLARRALAVLYKLGAVPAKGGEFTKRAFLNGKLDLLQAEAVADIINASGERAQRLAKEQLDGRFSQAVEDIAEPLRDILAELEAQIDFPEEEVPAAVFNDILSQISNTQEKISSLIKSYHFGKQLKEGLRVLLWGRPNAGKSSLLNLLLNEDRAIVTNIPGTTRDTLEEAGNIDGYSFVFCDSAGVQETSDTVEQIGVKRALEKLSWADLVLFIIDAADKSDSYKELLQKLPSDKKAWIIINKIDLDNSSRIKNDLINHTLFEISAKTEAGIPELKKALVNEIAEDKADLSEASIAITEERHKFCLENAMQALNETKSSIKDTLPLEITCASLRIALSALEELVGVTSTEDILGRIFSKFCIGK